MWRYHTIGLEHILLAVEPILAELIAWAFVQDLHERISIYGLPLYALPIVTLSAQDLGVNRDIYSSEIVCHFEQLGHTTSGHVCPSSAGFAFLPAL